MVNRGRLWSWGGRARDRKSGREIEKQNVSERQKKKREGTGETDQDMGEIVFMFGNKKGG